MMIYVNLKCDLFSSWCLVVYYYLLFTTTVHSIIEYLKENTQTYITDRMREHDCSLVVRELGL